MTLDFEKKKVSSSSYATHSKHLQIHFFTGWRQVLILDALRLALANRIDTSNFPTVAGAAQLARDGGLSR